MGISARGTDSPLAHQLEISFFWRGLGQRHEAKKMVLAMRYLFVRFFLRKHAFFPGTWPGGANMYTLCWKRRLFLLQIVLVVGDWDLQSLEEDAWKAHSAGKKKSDKKSLLDSIFSLYSVIFRLMSIYPYTLHPPLSYRTLEWPFRPFDFVNTRLSFTPLDDA